jgi:hypothetical protein
MSRDVALAGASSFHDDGHVGGGAYVAVFPILFYFVVFCILLYVVVLPRYIICNISRRYHEEDRRGGASGAEDAYVARLPQCYFVTFCALASVLFCNILRRYFSQQQKSSGGMQSFGSFASRNKHGSSQYR